MKKIARNALDLIGDTPILKLERVVPQDAAEVWLKIEAGNPTGSYKDRMAKSVLGNALKRGDVSPGDMVVEYTGGSTGSALAFVSAALSLKFLAVFSDAFSKSKQQTMEALAQRCLWKKAMGKASPRS